MKNLVLLLGLLMISLSLMADYTLLQENFEGGGLPAGWFNFSMTGSAWGVNSPGYNSNYKLDLSNSTPSSIDMVVVSTPAIDISGLNGAPLIIDYMLYQDIDPEMVDMGMFQPQYSYDGSTWNAITEVMSEVVDTWHPQQHVFYPEAQPQIYIGFLCYMLNNTGALLEFGIDDVQISAGAPELTLSATSFDFGTIFVGDYALNTLTVTNTGSLSLEYSFSVSTYMYMDINGFPYTTYNGTLGTGASQSIDIYYHPLAPYNYIGSLFPMTSNDPNNDVVNIILSASSLYPATGSNVIEFNGTNDWGESKAPLPIGANSTVTIETWFKVTGSNGIQFLTSSGSEKLEIHLDMTNNNLRFIPTTGVFLDTDPGTISMNSWTHLACVYNPGSGTAGIYINGVGMNVTNNGYNPLTTPISTSLDNVYLGVRAGIVYPFSGAMDEIRIWSCERTAEQIRNNKHLPLALPQPNLISYWRCDEVESKFLYDPVWLNYFEMYNYDASQRVAPDFAFGTGVAECLTVPYGSGVVTSSNTGVSLNVSNGNGQIFSVTRLDGAPLNPPTGQFSVFDAQTWVIQTFGSDQMTCDISYTLSEDLTSDDEANPNNARSNGRNANTSASFTNYVGAMNVNAATNQVTYGGLTAVPVGQQMIITRQNNPVFPIIHLDSTSLDFGQNYIGEVTTVDLPITNNGTAPLEYDITIEAPFHFVINGAVTQTCSGTVGEDGGSEIVEVYFAPTEECVFTGESFSIASNDPETPFVNVSLHGSAVAQTIGAKSVQFNGTNDYAKTFQPVNFAAGSAVTMEMWFNAYSGGGQIQFLTSSSMEVLEAHLDLEHNSLMIIPTIGVYLSTPENSIVLDTWTHLAFVYDPTNSYAKIYINGVDTPYIQSGYNSISSPIPTPLGNTRFGKRSDNTFPFFGAIDEIRIWSSVRSANDIRKNKHLTLSLPSTGLLAYWRCNETEGSALLEEINQRHAQLQYYNDSDRIDPGFVFGNGWSESYVAPADGGILDCSGSYIYFDFTSSDSQDIVYTYLYGAPVNPPTGCFTVFNDNTRIIQAYGSSNLAGSVTFSAFGNMTLTDETYYDNIRLYGRDARGIANFNDVTGASSVSAATDKATFPLTSTLQNAQQFIITRQEDPSSPSIDLNTTTLDFGTVFLGSTGEAWLQITNTGYSDLNWTITSDSLVTITDGAGDDVYEYSASCEAGYTYHLQLKYHPTAVGPQSGTVEITSNDPLQPSVSVEWSGEGDVIENGEYAIQFSGSNQNISVPADTSFCGLAYTIELWFMRPDFTSAPLFICARDYENYEIHLNGNTIRFIPAYHVFLDSPADTFVDGEWTHLACTYDPYNGTAAMYINGTEVTLTNHGTNSLTTYPAHTNSPFYIGSRAGNAYCFNGCMDEFRVWSCVRTADQIRLGMHDQPSVNSENLSGYWKMNYGEGTTVYDATRKWDGTINGATWVNSPLILGENITHVYQAPTVAGTLDCPEVDMSFEFPVAADGTFYITMCPETTSRRQRYNEVFDDPTRILYYYGSTMPDVTMTVGINDSFTDMDDYDPTNICLGTRTDGNFDEYIIGQGAYSVYSETGEAVYENPLNGMNGTQFYLVREGEPELGKPRGVQLTVAEGIVEITWDAVPGATFYVVKFASTPDGEFSTAPNGETTETTWSGSVTEAKMFYRISAIQE